MKISIIIPIYNVELYIERCIASVLRQTYSDLEVILVDDCSPDDSMAIARSVIEAYVGFQGEARYEAHEENRGLSAARNTGIDHATGDYLYFLDSDDEISPDCIESLVAGLTTTKHDFVIGNYQTQGTDKTYPQLKLADGSVISGKEVLHSYLRYDWYMMAWNKLVNRAFVVSRSLYFAEGLIHEDELWSFQLAAEAQSFAVVNRPTYSYCIREKSITEGNVTKRLESIVQVYRKMEAFAAAKGILQNAKVRQFLSTFAYGRYSGIVLVDLSAATKKSLYHQLRAVHRCRYNKGIKGWLKSLHLLFPPAVGYWVNIGATQLYLLGGRIKRGLR